MNKKLFLTSALAMGFVAPAMAVPSNTGSFPSGGLMQEDYTYTNAATSTNMDGVYEGTVNAVAQYTDVLYQIAAGEYLPADSETVTSCNQPGYFCPGVSGGVYYDENNAQGLTSCSTVGDGSYTSSDGTGSTSDSCYRTCSGNVTIAHATAVTGNDYYGNGTDTCAPTSCENGWHVKAAVDASAIVSTIGTGASENYAYVNASGSFAQDHGSKAASYYGLSTSNTNTWAVDYGTKGIVIGQGRCSAVQSDNNNNTWTNPTTTSNLTDETGQAGAQYCYCNVTGYKDGSGNLQSLSSSWVFGYGFGNANGDVFCANSCANACASLVQAADSGSLAYRAALFGTIESNPAMCEANTITINWDGASQSAINANNAGTATYGGNIRTPRSATHVPGKTFTGWRFVDPTKVQAGN